jgi:hypothetical protein
VQGIELVGHGRVTSQQPVQDPADDDLLDEDGPIGPAMSTRPSIEPRSIDAPSSSKRSLVGSTA